MYITLNYYTVNRKFGLMYLLFYYNLILYYKMQKVKTQSTLDN